MRIGIIGSGISGSYLAYKLSKLHQITLFEADSRPGGHTNTVTISKDHDRQVDTGFIVFNKKTYPNFLKLIDELNIDIQPAPMSFSLKNVDSGLEYRGGDLAGLVARKRNLLSSDFWWMIRDILRIRKYSLRLEDPNLTVGEFLRKHRFSNSFSQNYFIPMGSAIWSCSQQQFGDFSMSFIAKFFENHGLFKLTNRPQWYVIKGGSKTYLDELLNRFDGQLHLSTPITGIQRDSNRIILRSTRDRTWEFDHVVFACHSDQALKILGQSATDLEKRVLEGLPYSPNRTTLHTDIGILPSKKSTWASWNYLQEGAQKNVATVTYQMNILQSLKSKNNYQVTLNNEEKIQPSKIIQQWDYSHPTFDLRQEECQLQHEALIGPNNTSFCGAYWGAGFHEDGVKSAIKVEQYFRSLQDSSPISTAAD